MSADLISRPYDGTSPFPASDASAQTPFQRTAQLTVTAVIVAGPFAGLIAAVWLLWGHGLGFADVGLMVFFYLLTGFGVTVGFHRCLTHRSFTARPALRIALAVADPHSPYRYGTGVVGQLRGVLHAHAGWLLGHDPTSRQTYAPDMLADPAMRAISTAFPALCVVSLALPFTIGWAIGGARGAVLALLWAGLVRIFLLQHVTWSINSLCHLLGSRPFTTRRHDRATNLWPLAQLSLGESWHNTHHSDPTCARHGVDRGQVDLSAGLIRMFERAGWATGVRWPSTTRLEKHRRHPGEPAGQVLADYVAPAADRAAVPVRDHAEAGQPRT